MAWVFMDLEMKPVDKQFRRQWDLCRQEVIEFGAVKLGEDLREVDSFRALVKPAYGEIPPRYARLTGITNDMVADAAGFETVLKDLPPGARTRRRSTPGAAAILTSSGAR